MAPRQQTPGICGRIRCALTVGPDGQVPTIQRPPAYKATLALLKWWPYKWVTTVCSISHKDRKTNIWVRERTQVRYNQQCEKNEMVPAWAGHINHLKDDRWTSSVTTLGPLWQEKTRKTSQAVKRRPGQILERHDLAEDSTSQANLEEAC